MSGLASSSISEPDVTDFRFATKAGRTERKDEIGEAIHECIGGCTKREAVEPFAGEGIPIAPV